MSDDFDYGERQEDGQFENHPTIDEGEFVQPVRDSYVHKRCGGVTRMGSKLAKSFARDPTFYDKTFCHRCGDYFPVKQFRWKGTHQQLDEVGGNDDD